MIIIQWASFCYATDHRGSAVLSTPFTASRSLLFPRHLDSGRAIHKDILTKLETVSFNFIDARPLNFLKTVEPSPIIAVVTLLLDLEEGCEVASQTQKDVTWLADWKPNLWMGFQKAGYAANLSGPAKSW